ncbi:unnamed protein product, partial [Rangifer tarandus platyrhynchus]
ERENPGQHGVTEPGAEAGSGEAVTPAATHPYRNPGAVGLAPANRYGGLWLGRRPSRVDWCPSLRLAVFESRSEVKGFAPAARRASGSTAQTPSCSDTDFSETGKGSDALPPRPVESAWDGPRPVL